MSYQITRRQGNLNATLISASFATTQQVSADQANTSGRGVIVVLDVTAVNIGGMGTNALTLVIQGKDSASGKYYPLFTSAPVSAVSTTVYTLYPDALLVPNASAVSPLPATWRVIVNPSTTNPMTYTVGASIIQ